MSAPKNYGASSVLFPLTSGNDRRRACRYLVALPDGSLRWWEDSRFVDTPCRIIDISLVGCMVKSRSFPRRMKQRSIWFRPPGDSPVDWTEGIIVAVHKPWFREWQIRINFLAPFPYESFRSLVFGPAHLGEAAERESPEYERDHFWR
jgi:hypothetical protein